MTDIKKAGIEDKLMQTRADLVELLVGLDEKGWQTAVQSEDAHWSVADIIRHLMNAEKGMTRLIQEFQQGNDPVPPDFDLERYNIRSVQKTQELAPAALLQALATNRMQLLQLIDQLRDDDWQKKGRHASMRIMTIEEVCHAIANHEAQHLEEIKKAFNSQEAG